MTTRLVWLMAAFWFVVQASCPPSLAAAGPWSDGFEQGRGAWQPTSVGTLDAGLRHSGAASLKIVDDDDAKYFTTDCRVPVLADSRYELRFWTFARDGRNATLCVIQLDAKGHLATFGGRRLTHHCFPYSQGASMVRWVETKHVFTTGPTTALLCLRLNPADGSRTHKATVWFDDISLTRLGPGKLKASQAPRLPAVPRAPAAEKSLPLKTLPRLELDLGSETCAILCPANPALRKAADALADAIAKRAGRRPKVVDDATDPAALGRGPLVVFGGLTTGAAGRKLYLTGYDFTDYAWPGRGGRVVRTVRDPFNTGAHVLLVAGGWPEDVAAAAARAAEIVAERGPRLGYINDVKLGANADQIKAWTEPFLSDAPKTWSRIGPWGSWVYMSQIGRAAMGYLRTGDVAYLKPFKRELLLFFENDVIHRHHEAPSQIHSVVDALIVPWDLVADHPFFSAEDRKSIDDKFLFLACSGEGPRPLRGAGWGLRGNHGLGRALDAFWLGRYFWRRYRIEEGREWMALADNYFAPQMLSSKPNEDNSYHQFHASLCCTLMYALAAGKDEYVHSRALREAVERAILIHIPGRGPNTYCSAYAVAANDPRALSLMAHMGAEGYIKYCAAMKGASVLGEYLRSFCGFTEPKVRDDLLGVAAAPLDPMWYKYKQGHTNCGQYVTSTPPEHCYDKIAVRDGFGVQDFMLVVDGLCGGGHSFQDANCIVCCRARGASWLRQQYGNKGPTCSTVRQQNGVFVALDGRGPGAVHRCARLLYASKLGNGYDAVGSALEGIGDVEWHRHILRKRAAWTLVIDRAVARVAGEALVERYWHVRGKATPTADGLVSKQGTHCLHLQSAGLPPANMSGAADRKEVVRAALAPGGYVEIASILYVNDDPADTHYRLDRTQRGWRVFDGKAAVGVEVSPQGLRVEPTNDPPVAPPATLPLHPAAPAVALHWARADLGSAVTAVTTGDGCVAAGTADGRVVMMGLDARKRWSAQVKSMVLSLHFVGDDLLVGEDNGTISRLGPSGRVRWSVTIPYVKISWAHWSDKRSRIREITSADIDGDGEPEVLLSNGDRRVYAFTGAGKLLWKRGVRWGIYHAMTPTTYYGQFALFGGAAGPTLGGRVLIYGADGKLIGRLNCEKMESQKIRDVRLVDLDGDGKREIVCARDTNSQQLLVCTESRDPIWRAEVGGSPNAIAVRDYGGERQVLCASSCGYVHAFAGATGERRWWRYVGDDARMLWPRADGAVLALCPSGRVFVLSPDGKLVGCDALGARITGLLRAGEDRVAPCALAVGTEDGALRILAAGRK